MSALQRSQSSDSEDTPLLGANLFPSTAQHAPIESSDTAQDGVKQAEAITLAWSKKSLVAAYVL